MAELTRGEVIDRLARIMRDSLDPSFKDAPPPAWAEAAAAEIIAYHQPMLRDTILDAHLGAARADWERSHPVSDATPDLAAALERLAAKVPGVEPFRDVPGYGPCWCEGWERGYHEGWHHSEVCKRNRDDSEAIAEFRAALAASGDAPREGLGRLYGWHGDEPCRGESCEVNDEYGDHALAASESHPKEQHR